MTNPVFHRPDWTEALQHLQTGTRFRFADWPNPSVPRVSAGVYAIWYSAALIYVGMAGRGQSEEALVAHSATVRAKARGLADRLRNHASGRRSGDQFCVSICDRLVLPTLTAGQISQVAAGTLSLDGATRAFIHQHLSYSYIVVPDGKTAQELENAVKGGALISGRPLLNPGGLPEPRY
jgi:hypothetical protein